MYPRVQYSGNFQLLLGTQYKKYSPVVLFNVMANDESVLNPAYVQQKETVRHKRRKGLLRNNALKRDSAKHERRKTPRLSRE